MRPDHRHRAARLRRLARSPKGFLFGYLCALTLIALPGEPAGDVGLAILTASAAAITLDVAVERLRFRRWIVPDGAAITALLCTLVLAPQSAWYLPPVAGAIGVASKHIVRVRWGKRRIHVLNPAAAGLLATLLVFPAGQSWWGALTDRPAIWILALITIGIAVDRHVAKLPQALAFLATYYGLFSTIAFTTMGGGLLSLSQRLAGVYRPPFLDAALFFAFFMLTDPPTSPNRDDEQVRFGALAGAIAVGAYLAIHTLAFLLVGLLAANLALAGKRRRAVHAPALACPDQVIAEDPSLNRPTLPAPGR
jgi:Na+-translocating ferredoxin:NAD+ oxidoreductase RnfD subunit